MSTHQDTDPNADAGFIAATQPLWDGAPTEVAQQRNSKEPSLPAAFSQIAISALETAAERDKLKALNAELLEALKALVDEYEPSIKTFLANAPRKAKWAAACAAIAKNKG